MKDSVSIESVRGRGGEGRETNWKGEMEGESTCVWGGG